MKITLKKPKVNSSYLTKIFVKIGSNTLSQFFVLVITLFVVNLLSQNFFIRGDLTKIKIYSLSDGTMNIIKNADDKITLKTYFSENIPPDMIPVAQDVVDLYEEYARFSDGKIEVIKKDPKDENFKTDALEAGIPEIKFSEFSQDRYSTAFGFLGVSIEYKDNKEALQLITEANNLEYETSSRIYKLTHAEKTTVGFLTEHGEKNIYSDLRNVQQALERQFNVINISLSDGSPINPNEVKVLVIASPTLPLSRRDLFELDQYVMKGGRLLILADLYDLDYQQPLALNRNESNIIEFTKHYGADIEASILLDESFQAIFINLVPFAYPYWVLTQSENIDSLHPALSSIEAVVFFWTNPIKEARVNEDQQFTPLIKTTDHAWIETGDSIIVEPEQFTPSNQEQFILAALLEGKHISMFKDQEIPSLDSDDEEIEDKRTSDDERIDETDDLKIVIIGDGDLVFDQFLGYGEQNISFFVNTIEWLASSYDLIQMRSKNIEKRPLEIISESQKMLTKALNIALIPLLVIGGGIGYNSLRKRRKSSI